MAFGKKKKDPVTRKLTQTHKISVEGVLHLKDSDQVLIELDEVGLVTLASILREMDSQSVTIQVTNQRTDELDVDLELDE